MTILRAFAIALLLVASRPNAMPSRGGTVSGVVKLTEKVSKPVRPGRYPGEKAGGGEYLRGPAVVFIDGVKGPFEAPKKETMDQKGRQFGKLALPVLVGTRVEFPNGDDEYHQVFSNSKAKEMDLGRYAPGVVKEETFDKPGLVRLRCDIHKHMHAVILVLENPKFATCDEQGRFSIKDVPPGTYKIYAFQENYEPKEAAADPMRAVGQDLVVPATGDVTVQFDLR